MNNRTHIGPWRIEGKSKTKRAQTFKRAQSAAAYMGQSFTEFAFSALDREIARVRRLKEKREKV